MRHRFFRRRARGLPPSAEALTRRNVEEISRLEKEAEAARSGADRCADFFAQSVGSWRFVAIQTAFLLVYVALNLFAWARHWDPYPFILLNLLLNVQAAYTGPIIMMSQNRQSQIDTRRNHLDLQVNLLAEQETTEILRLLRQLCEKQGVPLDDRARGMEARVEPGELLRQIEREQGRVEVPKSPAN